jgi:hypothetical protein
LKRAVALLAAVFAACAARADGFMPQAKDVRLQTIRKAQGEMNWPFVADEGFLSCVPGGGERLVYFVPKGAPGENVFAINLNTNVMAMALINIGRGDAFRPYANFEDLIGRLSPYITMGKRLCDQPAGTVVPESSL